MEELALEQESYGDEIEERDQRNCEQGSQLQFPSGVEQYILLDFLQIHLQR